MTGPAACFLGISATIASVVIRSPAIEAVPLRLRWTNESVAWRYFADRRGPGRWARLLTGARAARDANGKEDGSLPESRIFSSNCSRDLRMSPTCARAHKLNGSAASHKVLPRLVNS